MTVDHSFGGSWTEKKLQYIKKYLQAYTTIFTKSKKASFFTTTYVDAFAGTGYRTVKESRNTIEYPLLDDNDAISFQKGSVQIALENDPPFKKYIFIDSNSEHINELKRVCAEYPDKVNRIELICDDANTFLCRWCRSTDWQRNRAVVFLDPYGMQVEWTTIEIIAQTKSIDLWLLFPLGQAVNRLLTKNHIPEGLWAERLTSIFGTEEWEKEFYITKQSMNLFGEEETRVIKDADFYSISEFFINRLRLIFEKVLDMPILLKNSRNVPIFLLCFASGNPKGAEIAVLIAKSIVKIGHGIKI